MKIINKILVLLFAILLNANTAFSAEKWDMALAYCASNFHSANAAEFAKNNTKILLIIFIVSPIC